MSQWEKLLERLRRRPPEMDFDDVQKILEGYGWEHRLIGKHHVFTRPGELRLTVPTVRGRKVRRVYLDEVIKRIEGVESNSGD